MFQEPEVSRNLSAPFHRSTAVPDHISPDRNDCAESVAPPAVQSRRKPPGNPPTATERAGCASGNPSPPPAPSAASAQPSATQTCPEPAVCSSVSAFQLSGSAYAFSTSSESRAGGGAENSAVE